MKIIVTMCNVISITLLFYRRGSYAIIFDAPIITNLLSQILCTLGNLISCYQRSALSRAKHRVISGCGVKQQRDGIC